jgi:hypothetical protein
MKQTCFDGSILVLIALILTGVSVAIAKENAVDSHVSQVSVTALPRSESLATASTQTTSTSTLPRGPKPVKKLLKVGQSFFYDETKFTFVDVVSDSRCPVVVVCIWAGEFTARFTVGGGSTLELLIVKNTTISSSTGYTVGIVEVKPNPVSGRKIENKDYSAIFLIERKK